MKKERSGEVQARTARAQEDATVVLLARTSRVGSVQRLPRHTRVLLLSAHGFQRLPLAAAGLALPTGQSMADVWATG